MLTSFWSDFVYVVIFYFLYPETKGKTLEEIEAIFGDDIALTIEEAGQKSGNAQMEKPDDIDAQYHENVQNKA